MDSPAEGGRFSFFVNHGTGPEPRVSFPDTVRTGEWYVVSAGWDGTARLTRTLTLPNGKRKYIRAADKETLDKKYNELKAQLREGIDIGNTTTVAQMAQTWYDVYKKPNLDDGARRNLLYVVNTWVLPYIGSKQVAEVKPIDIRTIMAKQEGMSESLQQKTLQAIRGIFDAAVENHLIAQSPAVKGIKANGKPAEEKKPLTAAQTQMLLKAVKDTRAYIAVAVMLGTGLRKEELCGLMWTDLDLDAGTLTVNRVLTFYGGKSRLTEDGERLLRQYEAYVAALDILSQRDPDSALWKEMQDQYKEYNTTYPYNQ